MVVDLLIGVTHRDDSEQHHMLVPKEVITVILQHLHNNMHMGQPGRDRTTSLVIDRFY